VIALPRVRAREQPGVVLPVRDALAGPREGFLRRLIVGQPRHRVIGELDRLGEAADIEVRERDQQRGVMRRLPVARRQLVRLRAIEDLATPILRLGERLPGAADLTQPAHAIEMRRTELRRRDRRAIRPSIALLAATFLGELQRVVVAGVRIRRHQARGDALMPDAHALVRAIARERLAPDREMRLRVHRGFFDQRQDRAAIDGAVGEAGDVPVATRDRMRRIELQDDRIEGARLVAGELREHAQERNREAPRRLRQRHRDLREISAAQQLGIGLREPLRRDAKIIERDVVERLDQRQPARRQPQREALPHLLRERQLEARAPAIERAVGPAAAQRRWFRTRRIEADLEPQHLVAPRHAKEPVDRVLGLRMARVEQPAGLVDQPLVIVIAERHDRMAHHLIEHDHRDQPRDVRCDRLQRCRHRQRAGEEGCAMWVWKRTHRK
jgi:hypothetical protein